MKYLIPLILVLISMRGIAAESALYSINFKNTPMGETPAGWVDLVNYRPSRNWAVDGQGFLRVMLKEYVGNPADGDRKRRRDYLERGGMKNFLGLLVYRGDLADGASPEALNDVVVKGVFQKTPDNDVSAGVVLRVKDRKNYYEARLTGARHLAIWKIQDALETSMADISLNGRILEESQFTIRFEASGEHLSAFVLDESGIEQGRVDAMDGTFAVGSVGLSVSTFAAVSEFLIIATKPFQPKWSQTQIDAANQRDIDGCNFPVVLAVSDPKALETAFDKISDHYDVVVAGAGTGGIGAALQAARMGASVLLLEETDLLGGQMGNAAVTSMDDGGIWGKNPVRERGIYREFHESAANHYYTLNKDPFTAYRFNLQSEGGYEPRVARAILLGLIAETRQRELPNGKQPVLDFAVRTKVSGVKKTDDIVTGVDLEHWSENGPEQKSVKCSVLIDATEYGDVIPLTGARYRVGTSTSDAINPDSAVQDHTWVGVIREYPEGIPDELIMKNPPPGYDTIAKRMKNYQLYGNAVWGGANRDIKGPRIWWVYTAWRGMPDSGSLATGELTEQRHTQCGLNGGNDYPVSAATMEDPAQRAKDELEGINRTLGLIYWFQHELGVPWAVSQEEDYFSSYNQERMKQRGVREDLLPIAARLPQWPYVRESRRIIGVETLRGEDLYTRDRGDEAAKHWASTVAINDYSFDLHGTEDHLEDGLDEHDYINATGPFAVPFGVFIPEKIDGFLPAEKNFSQSRLANGATRLQPSTMLNGQAVGAIAATAVNQGVQPRKLNIIDVQSALLASGDTLMSRWYEDVPYGTPLWQATQLLALYGMMDRPGPLPKDVPLGEGVLWGATEKVTPEEIAQTLKQLQKVVPGKDALPVDVASTMTRAELAILVADILRKHGEYHLDDPAPYAPPHDYEKARKASQKKKTKS